MPWSAFPCSFDSSRFNGSKDQPTDLCYDSQSNSSNSNSSNSSGSNSTEGSDLARSLTTDGYNSLFSGVMPSRLQQRGCSRLRLQDAARLVLTVDFR
uniref:Uncharacterized protein n=1 Tax=Tetradesmus obliquus TaxID=3088 RepID=A0A383W3J1_TETOB|eukprot:jgi/Sobl393_1/10015/SZX71574.1